MLLMPPNFSNFSMLAPPDTCSGVQIGPGATPQTRMPLGASCFAERFDVIHRRRLGLSVVVQIRRRIVGLFGRRADDDGAWLQMGKRRLDDPERRIDVGLHGPVELLGRDIEDRIVSLLAARIADENVEAAKLLHRVADKLGAEGFIAKIARQGHAVASRILDQLDHFLRIRLFVRISS